LNTCRYLAATLSLFSLLVAHAEKPDANFQIKDEEALVRGWTEAELGQIIADFERMNRDRLAANFSPAVHRHGDVLRVTFPTGIQPRFFCWFINYVQYPKGFDLKQRKILAAGRATIVSDFLPADQSLIGKRMTFYIPADDRDYDILYAHVDGQSYKFPFSSERWQRVDDPRLPPGVLELP
jgi:hypothetical protein